MAAQWPQQFQALPPHNYNGYQQQYSHQEHPQQQQYGPPQNGPYQQPYMPNPQAIPPPQQPQLGPNSCYNCGAAEHWAQDCPEPRREHPAGLINHQNFSRPIKRQKPNAPIITKYPVPPHVQQPRGLPHAYNVSQYHQSSYPAPQGPYGPPTPMSAQSPSQAQWQQSPQYQHHQNPYQQLNQHQFGGSYQQHSYPTPTIQTPSSYYSNSHSNHQVFPRGPSPYNPNVYPHQNQYVHNHNNQGPAFSGVPSSSPTPPTNGYMSNQYAESNKANSVITHPRTYTPNQALQSYSLTPKPQMADLATESEEDELYALDIPDMPPSSKNLADETILSGHSLIRLIGRPLPANFVVADAISPIEPPLREDEGRCQSKYWGRGNSIKLFQNIKDLSDWDDVSRDPIFCQLSDDSHIISVHDLMARYRPHDLGENSHEPEAEPEEREVTPGLNGHSHGRDTWDIMDSLENALNAGRGKQLNGISRSRSASKERSQPPKDTEQLLAALGVTGAPKPVRAPARPYPPPSYEQAGQSTPERYSRSRSRSPMRSDIHCGDSQSNFGVGSDRHTYEATQSSNHSESYGFKQASLPGHIVLGRDPAGLAEMPYTKQFEPPPPPPPPLRKSSSMDGSNNSPVSTGPQRGDNPIPTDIYLEYGNSYGRHPMDGHAISPTKIRSERSSNGRKREYDSRDSSDENETPSRRQVDDVTPKLKRRQPKVAEAYSRRW